MYYVNKVIEQQILSELEVETKDGPVHRLLAINHAPLDSVRREQETARLNQLVRDPSQQLAVKKQYDADERQLESLVRLLPSAFLYQYNGWDGAYQRLDFRPDPAFVPPTQESKALRSMAGTILVDPTTETPGTPEWAFGRERGFWLRDSRPYRQRRHI